MLDDGLFLACDSKLKQKAVMRSNFSSAVAGGEGLFNLGVVGNGVLCLESPSPKEELIEVTLQDDVLKVDGNMAIAWSGTLDFTVERFGQDAAGLGSFRGRSGQRLPRNRQGAVGSGGRQLLTFVQQQEVERMNLASLAQRLGQIKERF